MPTFSMNERQAVALTNYRGKLISTQDRIAAALADSGGNMAEAGRKMRGVPKAWVRQVRDGSFDIEHRVNREAARKTRYRAEMIARTETARAVSEGTLEGYGEAGVEKIRFMSSADACIVCLGYDGNVWTRAEGEEIIPVHPSCRCSWLPVVGAKAV